MGSKIIKWLNQPILVAVVVGLFLLGTLKRLSRRG